MQEIFFYFFVKVVSRRAVHPTVRLGGKLMVIPKVTLSCYYSTISDVCVMAVVIKSFC